MRVFLRRSAVAAVCLMGAIGTAVAQNPPAVQGQPEVAATKPAALSPAQQVAQGQAIAQRGQRLAERLMKMLEGAKKEGDVIRVNCLNDKLKQVNANVRNVDQRMTALNNASSGGDSESGNHAFTVLNVLAQKFDSLEQEAVQCLGKDTFEAGAAQVVTTIDPNSPTEDPVSVGADPALPPSVTVPPPLSPSK